MPPNDQTRHPAPDLPLGACAAKIVDVIHADEVMPLLLEACPSFASSWSESLVENADDSSPTGRLGYVDAADFIRHLVALRLANDTDEFSAVFDVIERLVLEGDQYVSELAVIGYLEGCQMMTVTARGLDPEQDFRPWLRPESEKWWKRINRFWAGDHSALRDGDDDSDSASGSA